MFENCKQCHFFVVLAGDVDCNLCWLSQQKMNVCYVKEILDNLNPRKAVGADGISPRLLRLSAPVMAEEITRLINFLIVKTDSAQSSSNRCKN